MQTATSQLDIQTQQAVIGRFASGAPMNRAVAAARPLTAGTAQVITIASGSPAHNTTYTLRVQSAALALDTTISYTTDADATAGEVETGLGAAWTANPTLFGLGTVAVGSDLVITMRDHTTDLTLTGADSATIALLTITETTAPSETAGVPAGRWVELLGPSGVLAGPRFRPVAAGAKSTLTLTIVHDTTGAYTVFGVFANESATGASAGNTVSFSGAGSAALTDAAAVAAFQAAFPGAGFVVTNPTVGTVILTAPLGWTLSATSGNAQGEGSAAITVASAAPAALPTLGWVLDPENVAPDSIGGGITEVDSGAAAPIVLSAPGSVAGVEASGATPSYGGVVYVETAAGANIGRPYTVQSSTGSRIALAPSRVAWHGVDPVDSSTHTISFL